LTEDDIIDFQIQLQILELQLQILETEIQQQQPLQPPRQCAIGWPRIFLFWRWFRPAAPAVGATAGPVTISIGGNPRMWELLREINALREALLREQNFLMMMEMRRRLAALLAEVQPLWAQWVLSNR
jgi:hypothetical protein